MKNLKHIILAASVLFSTPIQATLKDEEPCQCIDPHWSYWGYLNPDESVEPSENDELAKRVEPKVLIPLGMDDLYLVRFVTSVNDLSRKTWVEFKDTFTSFYEEAWKDKDPRDMGIKGTFKQFLHQQFDRAFEDLRTNPNAVFLSITPAQSLNPLEEPGAFEKLCEDISFLGLEKATQNVPLMVEDRQKPVLGIFARKDEYQFKGDDADHYRYADCLFLRLLVMRDASVMKQFPVIAKSLISETESSLGKRGIDAWLTVSRKGNPLAGMFEGLGFKPVSTDLFDDGAGSSYSTQDLVKNYPTGHYDYFLRDIEDDAVSSSEDESDEAAPESQNVSGGEDDDDPIVKKEDLRTSSDSTDPANNVSGSEEKTVSAATIGDIEDLGQQLSQVARPNTPAPVTDEEIKTGLEEFHDVGDAQAALVGAFFANDDAEKIWHL